MTALFIPLSFPQIEFLFLNLINQHVDLTNFIVSSTNNSPDIKSFINNFLLVWGGEKIHNG